MYVSTVNKQYSASYCITRYIFCALILNTPHQHSILLNNVHQYSTWYLNTQYSTYILNTQPFLALSWLDCGALINVDAPGCGASRDEARVGRFSSWGTVYPKFPRQKCLLLVAYKSFCRSSKSESALHKEGP